MAQYAPGFRRITANFAAIKVRETDLTKGTILV